MAKEEVSDLHRKYDALKEKVQAWENKAEDKIKEHPVQSVLIAFGAGILAGALVAALMRKK